MGQSLGLESETYLTCAASMLTSNRPICPQVYQQGAPSIFQLAVPTFSPSPVLKMDEFACLNMNVSVPENASGPLPVMVWIHGQYLNARSHRL
jgi:carboxylesterase type B